MRELFWLFFRNRGSSLWYPFERISKILKNDLFLPKLLIRSKKGVIWWGGVDFFSKVSKSPSQIIITQFCYPMTPHTLQNERRKFLSNKCIFFWIFLLMNVSFFWTPYIWEVLKARFNGNILYHVRQILHLVGLLNRKTLLFL